MNIAKLLHSVGVNLSDARAFGLAFPMRHVAALAGRREHKVRVPRIGAIRMRPGDSDAAAIRQVFYRKEYDLGAIRQWGTIQGCYRDILARGKVPVIIDAGANIGMASLWFAAEFPDAQIIAVEPDADNAALCRTNVAGMGNVRVEEAAIGSEPGFVHIRNPGDDAWALQTERAATEAGIEIRTVPLLAGSVPNGELFIVKVDIEGFESDLFASNTDWVAQPKVLFVEPHDWLFPGERTSASFQRELARHRYELLISGENLIYVRPD